MSRPWKLELSPFRLREASYACTACRSGTTAKALAEGLAFFRGHAMPTLQHASPPAPSGTTTAAKPTEEDPAQNQDPHCLDVRDGLPAEQTGQERVPQLHDYQADPRNEEDGKRRNSQDFGNWISSHVGSSSELDGGVGNPALGLTLPYVSALTELSALVHVDGSPVRIFSLRQRLG